VSRDSPSPLLTAPFPPSPSFTIPHHKSSQRASRLHHSSPFLTVPFPPSPQDRARTALPPAHNGTTVVDEVAARAAEALALARRGVVTRASATALHRALLRAQRRRAAGAPPDEARAARINLAAALITWGRRLRRPARMHRECRRLLQAALEEDPGDALARENLAILKENRRLRAGAPLLPSSLAAVSSEVAASAADDDDGDDDEDDDDEAEAASAADDGPRMRESDGEGSAGHRRGGSGGGSKGRAAVGKAAKFLHEGSRDGVHTPPAPDAVAAGAGPGAGPSPAVTTGRGSSDSDAAQCDGRAVGGGGGGDQVEKGGGGGGGGVGGGGDGVGRRRRWLAIGIPTVPRRGDPGYLARTLLAIARQLPTRADDLLHGQVSLGHSLA
jgi:hypothetical protein